MKIPPNGVPLPGFARVVRERHRLETPPTYWELRKLVLDGRLKATLVGRTYYVADEDVDRAAELRRGGHGVERRRTDVGVVVFGNDESVDLCHVRSPWLRS